MTFEILEDFAPALRIPTAPMKSDKIFNVLLLLTGLALSFFLSLGGWSIHTNYGIRTPGMLAADAFVFSRPARS
jgi:hypothetical protein